MVNAAEVFDGAAEAGRRGAFRYPRFAMPAEVSA
jgi:hypothetical protein